MHLTGDLSLGSIMIVVSIITMAVTIGRKFGSLEQTLSNIVATYERHEQADERKFQDLEQRFRELRDTLDRRLYGRADA